MAESKEQKEAREAAEQNAVQPPAVREQTERAPSVPDASGRQWRSVTASDGTITRVLD